MNLIFFGSSDYCLPILDTLKNNFQLSAIITKQNSEVKKIAQENKILVYIPKDKAELIKLTSSINLTNPDLAVVADYGLIIPKEVFNLPKYKTLNIHFSKLPKLRGPSPVQYTILAGEKSTWITVIMMDEDLDTGDIIWQKEIPLDNGKSTNQLNLETTDSLYAKLFTIIASDLPEIINNYLNGKLKPQRQDNTQATYTKHLSREDGFIPPKLLDMVMKGINPPQDELNQWQLYKNLSSKLAIGHWPLVIARACRALSPWPGLWTYVTIPASLMTNTSDRLYLSLGNKKRIKILNVHLETMHSATRPNRDQKKLILGTVQLEGKKPVSWKQFLEGYPNFKF